MIQGFFIKKSFKILAKTNQPYCTNSESDVLLNNKLASTRKVQLSFKHIELNRTFHKLSTSQQTEDDFDYQQAMTGTQLTWQDLLKEYRVVILSEAGSGKTSEIRHVAQKLRQEQKYAFFMRLEHIATDFDISFEEGSLEEFEEWRASQLEGWFLLDSVDEARLRQPQDFELAIRRFAAKLHANSALQRSHIIITSRGSAWRPISDLSLCEKALTYKKLEKSNLESNFYIVSLDGLNQTQMKIFAEK